MQLIIEIPKEFEQDWNSGLSDTRKFGDFFGRIIADIEHNLGHGTNLCGNYEKETAEMFFTAFKNATKLPNNYGKLIDSNNFQYMFDLTRDDPIYTGKDIKNAIKGMNGILKSNMEE